MPTLSAFIFFDAFLFFLSAFHAIICHFFFFAAACRHAGLMLPAADAVAILDVVAR